MKITTKLENICSKDELRPNMNLIMLKDKFLYATNGHILVKQALEIYPDSFKEKEIYDIEGERYIHPKTWKALKNYDHVEFTPDNIIGLDTGKGKYHPIKTTFPYFPMDDKPINYEKHITDPEDYEQQITPFEFGLNPNLFKTLAEGMIIDSCRMPALNIKISSAGRALMVRAGGISREKQLGIIMPAMVISNGYRLI